MCTVATPDPSICVVMKASGGRRLRRTDLLFGVLDPTIGAAPRRSRLRADSSQVVLGVDLLVQALFTAARCDQALPGSPHLDDEMVGWHANASMDNLVDVDTELVRRVISVRWGNLVSCARNLRVIAPRARILALGRRVDGMGVEHPGDRVVSRRHAVPPIMPRTSWPPMNLTSVPLIRGEPSRRRVAIMWCCG